MDEYSTQRDLNVFQEERDSKTVDKKIINVNNSENVASSSDDTVVEASSSDDTIVEEIDEDIAFIQEEAVRAAAKSIENMTNRTRNVKPNNLEIEAALSSADEATSSGIGNRTSRTECQLIAYNAEKMSEEARRVSADGRALLETITSTIEVLQSHARAFAMKACEATEVNTDRGYNLADFYQTMVTKYETTIAILEDKSRKLDTALDRVEDSAHECLRFAMLAEEIVDETLDEARRIKFKANWWTTKGKAAIVVALKRERVALIEMRRVWLNVRNDMEHEERAIRTSEDDSDYNTPECANKDRMTKLGHVVFTAFGISILFVTSLFEVGSDSYNAILALGLLTTGWCAVYWSHKVYKCLKSEDNDEETMIETTDLRDSFLENCDKNMERVREDLRKYSVTLQSDVESDTGSSETIRIEDIDQ